MTSGEGVPQDNVLAYKWFNLEAALGDKEAAKLRDIKAVIDHNSNLWWELKHQIFDMGYQTWYPMQEEYRDPVEAIIAQLEPLKRAQLLAEWRRYKRDKASYTDDEIMHRYGLMVIEEIVKRARSAGRCDVAGSQGSAGVFR